MDRPLPAGGDGRAAAVRASVSVEERATAARRLRVRAARSLDVSDLSLSAEPALSIGSRDEPFRLARTRRAAEQAGRPRAPGVCRRLEDRGRPRRSVLVPGV